MVVNNIGDAEMSDRDRDRLHYLVAMLADQKARVRYFDYRQAESAVETLAARLLEVVPREELTRHVFVPIPRGGLIVLGMLSYLLDLTPEQLPPTTPTGGPIVLVDDMALTGVRVREALDGLDASDVVVAHLGSHPQLRAAVNDDPRVRFCIAAFDLKTVEDERGPEHVAEVRKAWEERLDGRYWFGRSELVAFPWSEPEQILWDDETRAVEAGWRVVSPERCLKNRALLGPPAPDRKARHFRFPADIAFGLFEDDYLICRLGDEQVYRLDDVAGAIWGAIGTLGDVEAAARYLSTVFETDIATLTNDSHSMLSRLIGAGLLERVSPAE